MNDVARFYQTPPALGNQYRADGLLREYLERALSADVRQSIEAELVELGELGGGALVELQRQDLEQEPKLIQWDPWGRRIDRIELTPLWQEGERLAVRHGLVATAYEGRFGERSRVVQFALNYLIQGSLDVYSCPLAMTDGAARTLLDLGNQELIDRAVPHLISRDPAQFWTSGQWMTERTGGSDVSRTETVARKDEGGWRLYGTKWFTSAATSQIALTLARPEGNPEGSRGLAVFYLETRDAEGRMNGIQINRLKDKLGTRKVPTAELTLAGARAIPVSGLDDGVRKIASMLNVTRLWNSMGAIWGTRRAIALAKDYARRRHVFGALLSDKPLHVDTLAGLAAEHEGAFLMAFRAAELVGKAEHSRSNEADQDLIRALTPILKLTTAKQAVEIASEAIECFGGAGYVEDTGLPRILADAQVLPIWEGTTNVLSLDALRALSKTGAREALGAEIETQLGQAKAEQVAFAVSAVRAAVEKAQGWLATASPEKGEVEAGARRFAITLGRAYQAALMARHTSWAIERGKGRRSLGALQRFVRNGLDRVRAPADERWVLED